MDYELAKELKDTGFPQKSPKKIEYGDGCYHIDHDGKEEAYGPSLEELIEEVGSNFAGLYRGTDDGEEWHWVAMPTDSAEDAPHGRFGSTPRKAVARLWRDLNKEKSTVKA